MKPLIVRAEVDIERSPVDVFDYCSDHRHEPEWNPMMSRCDKLTEDPIGVGTQYDTEFVKAPPMIMECTGFKPPMYWTMTGTSAALSVSGHNEVIPTNTGARLVMQMELEPHGFLRLAAPVLRGRVQHMFEQDLKNIKGRLETDH